MVENAIRPTAVGKKNWMFFGSEEAGTRNAAVFTLVENCRMHGVEPLEYFKDVLERLGAVRCHQHVESLTRQRVADQLGDVTFVLGDQHPGRGTPDGGVIRPSRRHFAGVACHPHPRESVAPWCCGQMTAG